MWHMVKSIVSRASVSKTVEDSALHADWRPQVELRFSLWTEP